MSCYGVYAYGTLITEKEGSFIAEKFDFKKEYPDLYHPKATPAVIAVPAINFLYADGQGAPEGAEYQNAVSVLYTLTFTIKFSHKSGQAPAGYFEYTPPPLEGLWADVPTGNPEDRKRWRFTSLIRQPDFVTPELFAWALQTASAKKPELDFGCAKLAVWEEGLCLQAMHKGPFATEPETLEKMHVFAKQKKYLEDYSDNMAGLHRRHHELYLNDPNKTKPENMRTILRIPVRRDT